MIRFLSITALIAIIVTIAAGIIIFNLKSHQVVGLIFLPLFCLFWHLFYNDAPEPVPIRKTSTKRKETSQDVKKKLIAAASSKKEKARVKRTIEEFRDSGRGTGDIQQQQQQEQVNQHGTGWKSGVPLEFG